eukprot:CAMPEP_0172472422 /NCGR_PEP_ID=MMETSP1065-20121228/68328_1 /TAXON_ID=265537 /ORGANISM="Amphiprora paludosa, Strain CCMP125" /LENGTH=404 /DNA_ID=CAMNT_0013230557 /DNA_START=44 /DNA_END=1259 /DNA_ORIENTATION=+
MIMLSLRLRHPLVRMASVGRAFSNLDDEEKFKTMDKIMAKAKEQDAAQDAKIDEIIRKLGPVKAAKRANKTEDPKMMYRSIMACEHLLPPVHAEPLTLKAWKLDQAAGRRFTDGPQKVVRTLSVDNAVGIVSLYDYTSLVSAIFDGTRNKTQELKESGYLARTAKEAGFPVEVFEQADNAGMLMFMVACKNDDPDLLKAFYEVRPTFQLGGCDTTTKDATIKDTIVSDARALGGIKWRSGLLSALPPVHAEPLTLKAWKLDQAAGRRFTDGPQKMVRKIAEDNVPGEVPLYDYTSLVSAIFDGTRNKTQELKESGYLARTAKEAGFPVEVFEQADNAGMLMFMVACKNDDPDLLKAFYEVRPTFQLGGCDTTTKDATIKDTIVSDARALGGIKCAKWLAKRDLP